MVGVAKYDNGDLGVLGIVFVTSFATFVKKCLDLICHRSWIINSGAFVVNEVRNSIGIVDFKLTMFQSISCSSCIFQGNDNDNFSYFLSIHSKHDYETV